MDQVSLKSGKFRLTIFYSLVLNGDGDLVGAFVCLFVFSIFFTYSSWNTAKAGPPEGQTFQQEEYHRVTVRTHQGFPAQEGDATLDFVLWAWLRITVHCCVEFQKSSGCTFQKGVTYLERKVREQAIKYS